jgi:hypothetical protein
MATPQHRATEWRVGLGRLQERIELRGQEQQLIVELHEHVMLRESSAGGSGPERDGLDHEPRPTFDGELLP